MGETSFENRFLRHIGQKRKPCAGRIADPSYNIAIAAEVLLRPDRQRRSFKERIAIEHVGNLLQPD